MLNFIPPTLEVGGMCLRWVNVEIDIVLDSQGVGGGSLNTSAAGVFEYAINGGGVLKPAYEYTYFYVGGSNTIFIGRNTDSATKETGGLTFKSVREFFGVKIQIDGNVQAVFKELGNDWVGQSGTVTGCIVLCKSQHL